MLGDGLRKWFPPYSDKWLEPEKHCLKAPQSRDDQTKVIEAKGKDKTMTRVYGAEDKGRDHTIRQPS